MVSDGTALQETPKGPGPTKAFRAPRTKRTKPRRARVECETEPDVSVQLTWY